ncbi:MAG TPA: hypothetical protein VHO25_12255 [Polyangiaceae bacterium]|nr:hypothetical protein [Polyangiaceae bacterium]
MKGPYFINVNLEVWSKEDLAPLGEALEPKCMVLHVGKVRRRFHLGVEASCSPKTPDDAISELLQLVKTLPPAAKRLWKRAESRIFNVGYDAGNRMNTMYERPVGSGRWYTRSPSTAAHRYEATFDPEILRAVVKAGATLAITIYPPTKEKSRSK